MTKDLITLSESEQLPEVYKNAKDLPTKVVSERYGTTTRVKIFGWALCCMYSYIMNQQGYTFKQIQGIILENTQSPFYVSMETLWREAWVWKNILSKAPHFLDDPYLSKSHYKRMSQHKVPNPIEELEYIAMRKEEESVKHKKYSIRNWEEERNFGTLQKGYICDMCKEKVDKYYKICYNCMRILKEEK